MKKRPKKDFPRKKVNLQDVVVKNNSVLNIQTKTREKVRVSLKSEYKL